jgi:hypothetical protein
MKIVLFLMLYLKSALLVLSAQGINPIFANNTMENTRSGHVDNLNEKTKLYPVGSVLFSSVLAGGGQYYNGQYLKGVLMTGTEVGGFALVISSISSDGDFIENPEMFFSGLIISFGASIWSMIDAGMSAEKINKQNGFIYNYKINEDFDVKLNLECDISSKNNYNNTIYGVKAALFFN